MAATGSLAPDESILWTLLVPLSYGLLYKQNLVALTQIFSTSHIFCGFLG